MKYIPAHCPKCSRNPGFFKFEEDEGGAVIKATCECGTMIYPATEPRTDFEKEKANLDSLERMIKILTKTIPDPYPNPVMPPIFSMMLDHQPGEKTVLKEFLAGLSDLCQQCLKKLK